jgi:hypothetical protein
MDYLLFKNPRQLYFLFLTSKFGNKGVDDGQSQYIEIGYKIDQLLR